MFVTLHVCMVGGQKYIVQNIIFKFVSVKGGIFRDEEHAFKAAAQELKGLSSYWNCAVGRMS
jgi:Clustered mitochondria